MPGPEEHPATGVDDDIAYYQLACPGYEEIQNHTVLLARYHGVG